MKSVKYFGILFLIVPLFGGLVDAQHLVNSPDGTIQVQVKLTDRVYYNVSVDGEEVMWYSPLSMSTSQGEFGKNVELERADTRIVREEIKTVWGIRSVVPNNYNELQLDFKGGYSLIFRAFDDGIAYRFRSNREGELIVYDEEVAYRFWKDHQMINMILDSYTTSYEKFYSRQNIMEVKPDNLLAIPAIINQGDVLLSVMEADVYEYPGMYLSKDAVHNRAYLNGSFPKYVLDWEIGGTHMFLRVPTKRADYIAKTQGNRDFPWRAIAIAREDSRLADSDLVYKLSRPELIDTDWIRPGLVAWDWWNAMNLTGVDFETGVNNKTYEYFIDFAATNSIDYVIMDEGWSDQFDILLPTPLVDMDHLTSYARKKGVGLILWVIADAVDRQHEAAFKQFKEWGIAGIKVDFIDRDDQEAIEFYERIAREAAKCELLVDYHGVSKPTGLHRTYPNVVNFESVRGNEYNKFSKEPNTPSHDVDLVFTRMMAGPLDYTPGAMRNVAQGNFVTSFETPVSYGTRAHQLGMFIIYYAPLQMLCDAPTEYEKYPDILHFLSDVPVTWDDTHVIAGEIGKYAVIARRKGGDWYIGGLNDWTQREISIDLSDFTDGSYHAVILKDGLNANRHAMDYIREEVSVSSADKIKVTMKMGGGFAIKLKRE